MRGWNYGIPATWKWAAEDYSDWKAGYQTFYNKAIALFERSRLLFSFQRLARISSLSHNLSNEIKLILNNSHITECESSRKVVISVGNSILEANYSAKMPKNGGSMMLSIKWTRNYKNLWIRKKYLALQQKGKWIQHKSVFTWKKKIAKAFLEHKILSDLIFNSDLTPLRFASPLEATYRKRNSKTVPIANSDNKRQITGTFTVNILENFLPIQAIYTKATNLRHPKGKFISVFDIAHSHNH